MIRQARERLRAHDIGRTATDELHHLGREQPSLAHGVAQAQDVARVIGKRVDVGRTFETRRCVKRVEKRLADAVDDAQRDAASDGALGRAPQRILLEDGARDAEQEELGQPWHHGLASFGLDHIHDLVVRRRMELHEDLAHHAHARLGALARKRQRVEILHDAPDRALVGLVRHALEHLRPARGHPGVEQMLGRTLLDLVGARAVEALHEQVAVDDGVDGLEQHLRRDLEARITLVEFLEGKRDDGHVPEPRRLERLADERYVVGRAASAAGLRDKHGKLVGIVAAARDGFHDLTCDQDRWIADVVVDVLQSRVHRAGVHARQKLQVVSEAREDRLQDLEVIRRHLRRENRIARLLHLLGERDLGELGGFGLALLETEVGEGSLGLRDLRRRGGLGRAGLARHALLRMRRMPTHFGIRDLDVGRVRAVLAHRRAAQRARTRGGCFGAAIGLVLQGCEQRADADADRAQVRHLIDLEYGGDLAGFLENLLHLVGRERIEAAPEAHELHQIQVIALRAHLGGGIEARMVHPLVDDADRTLELAEMGDRILGQDRQAESRQKLGDGMGDLGVVVVRAAGEHDAVRPGLFHPREGLDALGMHIFLERLVLGPCGLDGGGHVGARGCGRMAAGRIGEILVQLDEQAIFELLLLIVGKPRIQERRLAFVELVDIQAQGLGIRCDDRAVVMIARAGVFLALPLGAGHPDEVEALREQVHHMAVRKLRRIAHAFGRHGLDAFLVGGRRRVVRDHDAIAQLREEREPERVVLVHVERARNAHGAARSGVGRKRLVVEEAMVLVFVEVRRARTLRGKADALFAAVARDEAAMLAGGGVAAEVVDREQAVVGATLAARRLLRGAQRFDFGKRQHLRACAFACGAIPGQERGAVGSHEACDVGAHGPDLGELLERAQHGVVQERAALHDDLRADLVGIADLDDFEQGILHDRDSQARRDVADGGAFLLRLLDAAVHEDGAAAAQIDRMLGRVRRLRERHDVEVQAGREAFDEASATRRACLVEHDVLDDAVLDAQALHVLAADVEDEFDARQHLLRAAQVRDRLDFPGVEVQRLEQEAFAVSRDRDVADPHERLARLGIDRHVAVEHRDGLLGGSEHVAAVVRVMAPQKLAVAADERRLERGRSGIDAQIRRARIAHERAALDAFPVVTVFELPVLVFAREQRRQTHDFAALDVAQVAQTVEHAGDALGSVRRAADGGARRDEEMGVLRTQRVLVVQIERFAEALVELGEILERTAEEGDGAADRTTACQAGDGLRHDGLEDGCRYVFAMGALVDERLHVGLGEHAAAACDRIDGPAALRELVQAGRIGVEQGRHLIDESTRAAGARAVHALLDALVEIDDLGVLAAELDDDVGLRDVGGHGGLGSDDLLNEFDAEPLREQKAARAGDRHGHGRIGILLGSFLEHFDDGRADVGMVTAVARMLDGERIVEHGHLHRG